MSQISYDQRLAQIALSSCTAKQQIASAARAQSRLPDAAEEGYAEDAVSFVLLCTAFAQEILHNTNIFCTVG